MGVAMLLPESGCVLQSKQGHQVSVSVSLGVGSGLDEFGSGFG